MLLSIPKLYAISNGAYGFPVSRVLCAKNGATAASILPVNRLIHFSIHDIRFRAKINSLLEST
jgi:hypothetical protein